MPRTGRADQQDAVGPITQAGEKRKGLSRDSFVRAMPRQCSKLLGFSRVKSSGNSRVANLASLGEHEKR
jgi:hypothetical protein